MPFFQRNDDLKLFYTDEGSSTGPPCLLLHGWICDSHDWNFQIPLLLEQGFRVIALDHRGHGRSSMPKLESGVYGMQTMAKDAVALLRHLDISEPVVLFGHSMGTVIASILAVEHPELVKALVLIHPLYSYAPATQPTLVAKMREDPSKAPEIAIGFFEGIMFTPRSPAWLRTWVRRRIFGSPPEAIIGCLDGIVEVAGTVMGNEEYMKRRPDVPRLAISGFEPAVAWEKGIGVTDGRDEVHFVDEGVFLQIAASKEVNEILLPWLQKTVIGKA